METLFLLILLGGLAYCFFELGKKIGWYKGWHGGWDDNERNVIHYISQYNHLWAENEKLWRRLRENK